MIVVTAPTSSIARQLLPRLLDAGHPTRVVARDPGRLSDDVRDRVEVVTGSHGDPAVVNRAFEGADAVFWLPPPDFATPTLEAAYVGFTRPAAEAFARLGVARVVGVSALGRGHERRHSAGLVTASIDMDDLIAASGVAYRALANPGFMDNLLRQVVPIRDHGVFTDVIAPDRRLPTCSTGDIAAVAARFLLDDTWTGADDVPVLGPEDLSYDDQAAIMTEVLGRPVRYQQQSVAELESHLRSMGASEAMVAGMVDMMTAKDAGLDLVVERTPETSSPTTFRQWCTDVLLPAVSAPA